MSLFSLFCGGINSSSAHEIGSLSGSSLYDDGRSGTAATGSMAAFNNGGNLWSRTESRLGSDNRVSVADWIDQVVSDDSLPNAQATPASVPASDGANSDSEPVRLKPPISLERSGNTQSNPAINPLPSDTAGQALRLRPALESTDDHIKDKSAAEPLRMSPPPLDNQPTSGAEPLRITPPAVDNQPASGAEPLRITPPAVDNQPASAAEPLRMMPPSLDGPLRLTPPSLESLQATPSSSANQPNPFPHLNLPALREAGHAIANLHLVTADIIRGAQPDAQGFALLLQAGVKTIVDLRDEDKLVQQEGVITQSMGFNFISIPLDLFNAPPDKSIQRFMRALSQPGNQPVFIHCQQGQDRTGTMVALYRMAVQGWTVDQAYKEMLMFGFHPQLGQLTQAVHNYAARLGQTSGMRL